MTAKAKKPVYAALSISHHAVELAVFNPKSLSIEQATSIALPEDVIHRETDVILQPDALIQAINAAKKTVGSKFPALVHLSLPGTLVRLIEMPKIDAASLYVSLSSEAERYKTFDSADAIVDFEIVENPKLPPNMQQVLLGAVRSDSLTTYLKILKACKLKAHTIGLEPLNVLRGLAGTGVLDGLVQQIGTDAHWGMILADPTRVRFSLWQCDHLLEFRELAMNTHHFGANPPDPIVVEDLLEEIRRTTKTWQPVLWMTENMPAHLCEELTQQLGCPVRPSPVGNAVSIAQPLSLATIGTAMTSVISFPFSIDISVGLSKAHSGASSGGSSSSPMSGGSALPDLGDSGGSANWLIPAGVVSLVLSGIVTAGLWGLATWTGSQIPEQESKYQGIQTEISGLETRIDELKKKLELDDTLISLIEHAKQRNQVYVALTKDLKEKTPQQLWIQSIELNESMELEGKALSHKSIINFAKSFDAAPYSKAVLIDSIMEGQVGQTTVYDFKISGGIHLPESVPSAPKKKDTEGALEELSDPSKPGA